MSSLDELRSDIVRAMLPHVTFDGWSKAALRAGALDCGENEDIVERLFPRGLNQAAEVYSVLADEEMAGAMEAAGVGEMKVRDRITAAVRLRLEAAENDREAIRRLMSYLAVPGRKPLAARLLMKTVDTMWYAAGDNATDFNYYTKRGLLAGVYGSTVLYWLNDESEGCEATWEFLDRRIGDVMKIPKLQARVRKAAGLLPSPFKVLRVLASRRRAV